MPVQHVKDRPIIIGLTGGIASGKTTASKYFESHLIPVIDSDAIVKELWLTQHDMLDQIESVFNTLDKTLIASSIFSDKERRETLNRIVHPYVFDEINRKIKSLRDERMIVIDMPLLFEVGYQDQVDYTALVYTDEQTALKRLVERDGLSKIAAKQRVEAQMPIEEKRKIADFVLDNTGDEPQLIEHIENMLGSIWDEEQFDL